MKSTVIFCSGVVTGIVGVKIAPKTKYVKTVKYIIAVFKAQSRLNKVLEEEYWRIDEAIEIENKFFKMIKTNEPLDVTFSVIDNDGQRRIHISLVGDKATNGEN